MGNRELSFEIDEKGRVICKSHSNYDYLISPRDYFQDLYLEARFRTLNSHDP